MKKLKNLSVIIRDEQKKNNRHNDEEKRAWVKEVDNIDRLEAEGNLSGELSLRRTKRKTDILLSDFKAQIWYQKSKRLWNTEGDENTSFFHKICSARQRRSIISNINSDDGVPCTTNENIAKTFLDHFEGIYNGGGVENPWLIENLNWSPISTSQAQNLCSSFSEEEIHSALTAFSNNKSPSPDGFTMEFFKAAWFVLKDDIFNIFRDFHTNCIINKAVNITNIALIAKKEKCAEPADYRPISLTTSIYKLIAKVIAERLKETLPSTAFDKLNWRRWIKACISSVQYSIIINGRPRDDILLFVEDDEHSLQNLKNIINLFQLASGLNINLNKSTISPINIDAARTDQIASQWGITTKFFPINYLGVPLGEANPKGTSHVFAITAAAAPLGFPSAKEWIGFKGSFCENGRDSPTWILNSDGFYSVASVKKALLQPDQGMKRTESTSLSFAPLQSPSGT
ncbi:LINE-1 retrotransposable element ORF2 protein [Cucumis melo var. makuwa]|uniref:LINE-1 retrotransposable element ORF2 protein n=1 Tax=Cucumis melo var. makuwa TaxID=1194695 RepID=A0A5A7U2D0_CUCMM|nr:LINE-1 retrotransposable element ORF2 protein [Cucumis melo var. makuwa]